MYSILVLGQIPGTNIQISFQVWLLVLGLLLGIRPAHRLYLRHQITLARIRRPLPASRLHRRLPQPA